MEKDRMTLLLVTPGSKGAKSINIKISHFRYAFIFLFVFALISVVAIASTFTFYQKSEGKKESINELVNTVQALNQDLNQSEVVEAKLRTKLKNIETKLIEMQKLLDKKGLKNELSVGGEYIPADRLSVSYVEFMQKDIDELLSTIEKFPVGKPLKGRINSSYGYRKDPYRSRLAFHSGIDLDAYHGQSVLVTADGTVTEAGWKSSYGKAVVVRHKDNFKTLYGHLSAIKVKEGQKVKAGQVIGKAGSTGRSTGTHLHYEIIKDGKTINPKKYLTLK